MKKRILFPLLALAALLAFFFAACSNDKIEPFNFDEYTASTVEIDNIISEWIKECHVEDPPSKCTGGPPPPPETPSSDSNGDQSSDSNSGDQSSDSNSGDQSSDSNSGSPSSDSNPGQSNSSSSNATNPPQGNSSSSAAINPPQGSSSSAATPAPSSSSRASSSSSNTASSSSVQNSSSSSSAGSSGGGCIDYCKGKTPILSTSTNGSSMSVGNCYFVSGITKYNGNDTDPGGRVLINGVNCYVNNRNGGQNTKCSDISEAEGGFYVDVLVNLEGGSAWTFTTASSLPSCQ